MKFKSWTSSKFGSKSFNNLLSEVLMRKQLSPYFGQEVTTGEPPGKSLSSLAASSSVWIKSSSWSFLCAWSQEVEIVNFVGWIAAHHGVDLLGQLWASGDQPGWGGGAVLGLAHLVRSNLVRSTWSDQTDQMKVIRWKWSDQSDKINIQISLL